MKLTRYVIGAAVPIVLLFLGLGQQVQAHWGPFGNGWNGNGPFNGRMGGGGLGQFGGLGGGAYRYESGYQAGISDAIYDNNLAYNPVGQCLSCHSELYWHGFHQGYDQQYNSYQNQESTQGTSINIYGNNNYVNTNQYSGQNQQGPDFNSSNCLNCNGGPDP